MPIIQFMILSCAVLLIGCDDTPTYAKLDDDAVVLALGDSLTAGYGAQEAESYPTLLDKRTPWTVINGGVSGDTSAEALERLPALLQLHQPDLVIVSIGGNDFLQQINENTTIANIEQIIMLSEDSGAEVLLIGVPYLSVRAVLGFPKDHAMYERLASDNDLALLSDGWRDILAQESLRYDDVHPNAQGYALFTDVLVDKLQAIGWL